MKAFLALAENAEYELIGADRKTGSYALLATSISSSGRPLAWSDSRHFKRMVTSGRSPDTSSLEAKQIIERILFRHQR